MNKQTKLVVLSALVIGLVSSGHAAIDLTPVTGGLDALGTAVLAVAGAVITGAIALFAIKRGGVWLKKLWGSFSS